MFRSAFLHVALFAVVLVAAYGLTMLFEVGIMLAGYWYFGR